MSVNFGYGGYGMMNGMMMNGMMGSQGNEGNTFQEMQQRFGCSHCYQIGPVPYNYQMQVNPLHRNVTNPSLISRIIRKFMGA